MQEALKTQRRYYSGKKKKHTIKSQVVVETQSLKILSTAHARGKEHDFQLLKRSQVKPLSKVEMLADKGYQGLREVHRNSYTPVKKQKKQPLSSTQKQYNRELAQQRIFVEHVIRCLKVFRILASPYRNRRRRFGLRFNLIAGLYNRGLELAAI